MASKKAAGTRSIDERIIHAVRHPVRADALAILCERVASPNEIASILDEDVTKVSNHVGELEKEGIVELVETKPRRNTTEHFYRATMRPDIPDEEWAALSKESRAELTSLVFEAIVAEGLGALRRGAFDSRLNRHLSWRVMHVDDQGFDDLAENEAARDRKAVQIEAESIGRMEKSGEPGLSVVAVAMAFERAQRGRSPRPDLGGTDAS